MTRDLLVRQGLLSWMLLLWLLALGACSHCPSDAYSGPRPQHGLLALSQDYYVVRAKPGDTYMGLAWEHNVSPYEVISLNQVEAPYRLEPGDLVRIPTPRVHVVRRGETLMGIARSYRIGFYDLAQANALYAPFTIYPGQVLVLPGRTPVFEKPHKAPVYAAVRPTAPPIEDDPPRNVPLPAPKPGPVDQETGKDTIEVDVKPRPKPQAMAALDSEIGRDVMEFAEPEPVEEAPKEEKAEQERTGQEEQDLIWPVRGPIISEFGPTGGGRRNDGINIAVPERTPVRAAADGVVIYRGNEVPGFGNLILIRHANDLVTAYAHTSEFRVNKGERVRKGETIALSGSTGNVSVPQLHFEVRRGVQAVDPIEHLKA